MIFYDVNGCFLPGTCLVELANRLDMEHQVTASKVLHYEKQVILISEDKTQSLMSMSGLPRKFTWNVSNIHITLSEEIFVYLKFATLERRRFQTINLQIWIIRPNALLSNTNKQAISLFTTLNVRDISKIDVIISVSNEFLGF